MYLTKDELLEEQAVLKRAGIEHVPYAEMLTPMRHLLDGYVAITTSLGSIGIPCGYIGVPITHPLFGVSCKHIDRLDDAGLGIVYAGVNPTSIDIMKDTQDKYWYFGVDSGADLKATRQDIIEMLRAIVEFLDEIKRDGK